MLICSVLSWSSDRSIEVGTIVAGASLPGAYRPHHAPRMFGHCAGAAKCLQLREPPALIRCRRYAENMEARNFTRHTGIIPHSHEKGQGLLIIKLYLKFNYFKYCVYLIIFGNMFKDTWNVLLTDITNFQIFFKIDFIENGKILNKFYDSGPRYICFICFLFKWFNIPSNMWDYIAIEPNFSCGLSDIL